MEVEETTALFAQAGGLVGVAVTVAAAVLGSGAAAVWGSGDGGGPGASDALSGGWGTTHHCALK